MHRVRILHGGASVQTVQSARVVEVRHPESQALEHNYLQQKKQFEEFVNSEWYTVLTKVPAEVVLKAVEKAVEQELKQKQPNKRRMRKRQQRAKERLKTARNTSTKGCINNEETEKGTANVGGSTYRCGCGSMHLRLGGTLRNTC